MAETIHLVLTAVLAVLVVVLSGLVLIRARAEKKQADTISRLSLAEFAELLRSSSLEGTIQVVAGKVSDLLKRTFECERIVFIRKQRAYLDLNYYHAITHFSRQDFRLRYTRELADRFRENYMPRSVESLDGVLPSGFVRQLERHGLDICFPIFWRENLYGVYFIKSNLETSSESFNMMIAVLGQALSAAYHIKWHEQKLARLRQDKGAESSAPDLRRAGDSPSPILKLVRHRNSNTLVREIVSTMCTDLGLERASLLYETGSKDEPLQNVNSSRIADLVPLERPEFNTMAKQCDRTTFIDLDHYGDGVKDVTGGLTRYRKAGLKHVMPFPLPAGRVGLFAWDRRKDSDRVIEYLRKHRETVKELVKNAESFEKAEELSYTDGLTGLANQRYFKKRLNEEVDRAKRYQRSMALIILDMDDLKGINDNYGHQAGDAVIKRMGQVLGRSIRAIDVVARYGGDEFCVIMPEAASETCERFMHRLHSKIASAKFSADIIGVEFTCTISLGGAVFPDHANEPDGLIFAADMALLKAKESGRNGCVLYEPVAQES